MSIDDRLAPNAERRSPNADEMIATVARWTSVWRRLTGGRNPVRGRQGRGRGPRHGDDARRLSSATPWPESPGPHSCASCGRTTCPACMRAGVDCGVCRHETDPLLLEVLNEAWEKGWAYRALPEDERERHGEDDER